MAEDHIRNIHQIVTADGKAFKAIATENVFVGYGPDQQFGFPTGNNEVTPLTTGKEYFAQLIIDLDAASEEIYIIGWQVNWDALLAPNKRLFDIILAAAKRNVKIYVMPWNDSPPVQTYDDQTKAVLEAINTITGSKNVEVQLATATADKAASFFSHHQKQVVIDRKIAFIGGLDLAYGRFDDASYDIRANAENRYGLNRYNGCVEWVGTAEKSKLVDPDELKGGWDSTVYNPLNKKSKTNAQLVIDKVMAGAWQTPYEAQAAGSAFGSMASPSAESNTATSNTLAASKQPRMPWQDVHCKIVGPAVSDLMLNFVIRWNTTDSKAKLKLPNTVATSIEQQCLVQVLRSAPLQMRLNEYKALDAKNKKALTFPARAQDDIHQAMLTIIDKAQHFIYIENQFFVSAFGSLDGYESASATKDPDESSGNSPAKLIMKRGGGAGRYGTRIMPGDETGFPQNKIVEALAKKINSVIFNKKPTPFHVYVTLPVHSEGLLSDGAVMAQVHWTMQSLVFGTKSLLNSIRRSLKAREIYKKNPKDNWRQAYQDGDKGYESIPLEDCFEYVTLLNLRNWAKIGNGKDERYITEQIYVHSKAMIVDDRYAILGSANINDRSLLGSRDSEIAVLVVDTKNKKRDLKQNGKQVPVRHFARDLRKKLWRKIFGITAGGDKAANELKQAVLHPAAQASWKAIQKRAQENTDLYEAAFDWIPRNTTEKSATRGKNSSQPASIWPRWDKKQNKTAGPMPFDADFWTTPQHSDAAKNLVNVKGFITALPVHWTENENNKIPYHAMLLTQVDSPMSSQPSAQIAANTEVRKQEEVQV